MSSIVDFISILREKDIKLQLEGEKLKINAPKGALTDDVKDELRLRKAEVISFLRAAKGELGDIKGDIPVVKRDQELPLSFAQTRLWLLDQIQPNSLAYHMPMAVRLKGALNVDTMTRVLGEIVRRHESLRTTFTQSNGIPSQVIQDANQWQVHVEVHLNLSEEERNAKSIELATAERTTPFNLETGPLFRVSVIEFDDLDHALLATMHHIVSDGWSNDIFMREIASLYMAYSQGLPSPLPELPIQYADFSHWQRQWLGSEEQKNQLDYWVKQLRGAPDYMGMPTDHPRPKQQTLSGAVYSRPLSADCFAAAKKMNADYKTTTFMVMLAAYQILLSAYARQKDICVGIPSAGRSHKQIEGLIGFFVNALVMRTDLSGNPTVKDFMQRIKTVVLGAFDHQDVPIEMIVEELKLSRSLSYTPIVQCGLTVGAVAESMMQDANDLMMSTNLKVELIGSNSLTAKYDMILGITEASDSLSATIEYNVDLYDESTIAQFVSHFERVVVALSVSSEQVIDNLFVLDEQELFDLLAIDRNRYEKVLPLTTMQRDIYLSAIMKPETLENSLGVAFDINGPLNISLWRRMLQYLSDQRAALRVNYVTSDKPYTESVYQCFLKPGTPIALDIIDVSNESLSEDDIQQRLDDYILTPYAIHSDSLVRYGLLKLTDDHYIAMHAVHHSIMDALSLAVHKEVLLACYDIATKKGINPEASESDDSWIDLALPEDKYFDYVAFNQTHFDTDHIKAFWQGRLINVEPLDMPVNQRWAEQPDTQRLVSKKLRLSDDHWKDIRDYCFKRRITPTIYFRCLYAILLSAYCRAEADFVLTEFTSGRPPQHGDGIACYYQSLPILIEQSVLQAESTIDDVFAQAKVFFEETKSTQYLSILAQRQLIPQGRLAFSYNFLGKLAKHRKRYTPNAEGLIQFLVSTKDEGIYFYLDYPGELFDDINLLKRIEHLSKQIVGGTEKLRDLSLVMPLEEYNLTSEKFGQWNATYHQLPVNTSVQQLFEEQVANSPDAIALVVGNQQLSYSELNCRANKLAHYLREMGVTKQARVGICLNRSVEMMVAVLGVLKSGASYVPMDASYPPERLAYILEDFAAPVLLTQQDVLTPSKNGNGKVSKGLNELVSERPMQIICLDTQWRLIESYTPENPVHTTVLDDRIYTIYTSGSTGKPKGASVKQRGELNLLQWYTREFAITATDRCLIISAFGFDLTQKNLFAVLVCGGTLVLPDTDLYDADLFTSLIRREQVSIINCAPSAFYPLMTASEDLSVLDSLRLVLFGGESIHLNQLSPWFERDNFTCEIVNMYGPTECTDIAAYYRIPDVNSFLQSKQRVIPIGRPNDNVHLYVLNQHNQLVPPGVVGELCITGQGVGTGYLKQGQLTAEKFKPNPFGDGMMYRTGDLVRFVPGTRLPQSDLEYIDRIDFQVKVRGLRIELGEIQYALRQVDGVDDAIVLVKDDSLVAFIIGEEPDVEQSNWRSLLADYLPDYMVPTNLITLDSWPLSPNGKVDRKALLAMDVKGRLRQAYIEPRTDTEREVARMWGEVLNIEKIGVNDHFFELGGQSLLATQVVSRLKSRFDMDIPLRILFETATVENLAKWIDQHKGLAGKHVPSLTTVSRDQPIPLSFAQERLWVLSQLEPGSSAYNMPAAFKIIGPLDIEAIRRSLEQIVYRHEILRTTFADSDSGPVQIIHSPQTFDLPVIDLTELSDAEKEEKLKQYAYANATELFDLNQGPLLKVRLYQLTQDQGVAQEYAMTANMHHIVSDGWSMKVLLTELALLYPSMKAGVLPTLPPLEVQYADYAVWQRQWLQGEGLEQSLAFWRSQFASTPTLLQLPIDRPRPSINTRKGAYYNFDVSKEVVRKVEDYAQNNELTNFVVGIAAFQILLARYTKQTDICIGIPTSGRNRVEIEPLIGFFINALLLRFNLAGNPRVADVLTHAKGITLQSFEHENVPVEMILNMLSADAAFDGAVLGQVAFNFLNQLQDKDMQAVDEQTIGELSVSVIDNGVVSAKAEIMLIITELDGQWKGQFEYNTDLFDEATIALMARHYNIILKSMFDDDTCPIEYLPMLTEQGLFDSLGLNTDNYESILPLTTMQRDIYLSELAKPGTLENAIGFALDVVGEFDLECFKQSVLASSQQLSVMRTQIIAATRAYMDLAYQAVLREPVINVAFTDVSAESFTGDQLLSLAENHIFHAYDVHNDDLCTYHVYKLADRHHFIVGAMHHLIMDGAGCVMLLHDYLCANYEVLAAGDSVTRTTDEFPVYVAEHRVTFDKPDTLDYWRQRLQSVEPLNVPLPREKAESRRREQEYRFSSEHAAEIRQFCFRQRITPTVYFKCLYSLLLDSYFNPDADFQILEFLSARSREAQNAIGCCYQALPFVVPIDSLRSDTIDDLFEVAKAYHADVQSIKDISLFYQRQFTSHGRLTFSFNLFNFVDDPVLLKQKQSPRYYTPLADSMVQLCVYIEANEFRLAQMYYEGSFDDCQFLPRLDFVSRQIVSGTKALSKLDYLLPGERAQLFGGDRQWNNAYAELVPDSAVQTLFEKQVARTPDAEALICGARRLSYAELNSQSNQLAHYLREQGIQRGSIVGICIGRTAEFMLAVLGVMKSGAAYMPMDVNYPQERLRYMLDNSGAKLLLTTSSLLERHFLEFHFLEHHSTESQGGVNDEPQSKMMPELKQLALDRDWQTVNLYSTENPVCQTDRDDLLYVIYTSGSTGQPKGVLVKHRGELNLLNWYTREYGFGPLTKTLIISAFGFDLTQKNFFAPLITGGVVVFPDVDHYDDQYFRDIIQREKISCINCAPSAFYPLTQTADALAALASLDTVLLGGEPIQLTNMADWINSGRCRAELVNMYGPTECTDIAATYRIVDLVSVLSNEQSIPIGRPNDNVELYVLNRELSPIPIGCVGELYITGEGVGAGYLGQDDLTKGSFLDNPFGNGKLYRTGDLARFVECDHQLQLEYIGRVDFQVKIRGLRIELSEIEHAIRQISGQDQVLVLAKDDYLYGFVVSDVPLATKDWRQQLTQYLPEYMIPVGFQVLEAFPLSANGKIDRQALLARDLQLSAAVDYVAPRNDIEAELVSIWQQILRLEKVGVQDNFFDIGGHSLLATQVISHLRRSLGVDLPLRVIFEQPTIAALAEQVMLAKTGNATNIAPVTALTEAQRMAGLPLSFAQQRLWLLDQIEPNNTAYHMPTAFRLKGNLDIAALQKALAEMVRRHEILRTTFDGDEEPVQHIHGVGDWQARLVDLSDYELDEQESEVKRYLLGTLMRPFDLAKGPLFRAIIITLNAPGLASSETILATCVHHIIADGWSANVFMHELGSLYLAYSQNMPSPLPELELQYGDYTHWQRQWLAGEILEQQVGYWRKQLANVPVLNLPTDRARPAQQHYEGDVVSFELPGELVQQLRDLSSLENVTLFMTLLAGFNVLLYRYSGQDDFCVGTPIANRTSAELEALIGLFVNSLAIRADLSGGPTFQTVLQRVRETTLAGYEHQHAPFEQVVDELNLVRGLSHSPIFQVLFVLQNTPAVGSSDSELPGGIKLLPLMNEKSNADLGRAVNYVKAKFDLTMTLVESGNAIQGHIEYVTALFDRETVARLATHYECLLQAIVAEPGAKVDELSLLSAAEVRQFDSWNATSMAYDSETLVPQLFEAQVARTPDNIAVAWSDQTLSYAQLNGRANQLAHYLQSRGVASGVRVGICVNPSLDTMVAIFAVLKAGGTYVPMDPNYPLDRLSHIVHNAAVNILLTQQSISNRLPTDLETIICLDQADSTIMGEVDTSSQLNLPVSGSSDDLLYIIYTSGSTGVPKGVCVTHRGEVNLLTWYVDTYGICETDRCLVISALGFDLTQKNLFAPLISGATLVFSPVAHYDNQLIVKEIADKRITVLNCAPSAFYPLVELTDDVSRLNSLRHVLFGGEPIRLEHLKPWLSHQGCGAQLTNMYGPTECTDIAASYTLEKPLTYLTRLIPIGKPNANVALYVVNSAMRRVPIGVVGELCIGGDGVGAGYLGLPDMTDAAFIDNPFGTGKLYRSGDLVKYLPDGNIVFMARKDDQVKIRGLRIELSEIDMVLNSVPEVKEGVVLAVESVPGQPILVAYMVAEAELSLADVTQHLKSKLPDYMVPTAFVKLDALPLTPNGKLDKEALPLPDNQMEVEVTIVAPRDETEKELLAIWQKLLSVEEIGVEHNFFALGGHSLLVAKLVKAVNERFDVSFSMSAFFTAQTIAEQAGIIKRSDGEWSPLLPIQEFGDLPILFCVHPIEGEILCYIELSKQLGTDQPLFGFQAKGFEEGHIPADELVAMASEYVAAMRRKQPKGPYYLLGHSFGGVIAYEMALQLRAAGETVAFLGMLDSYTPRANTGLREMDEAELVKLILQDETKLSVRKLRKMSSEELYQLCSDHAAGYLSVDHVKRGLKVVNGLLAMYKSYEPGDYDGKLTLFRPAEYLKTTQKLIRTALTLGHGVTLGWDKHVDSKRLSVIEVPGEHYTMLMGDNVVTLAENLATQLVLARTEQLSE